MSIFPACPFNELTPAEAERLALLAEECSEVGKAIGKILRHGYESKAPATDDPTNREQLTAELGDVLAALYLLTSRGDISLDGVLSARASKLGRVWKYLHHQEPPSAAELVVITSWPPLTPSTASTVINTPGPVEEPPSPQIVDLAAALRGSLDRKGGAR